MTKQEIYFFLNLLRLELPRMEYPVTGAMSSEEKAALREKTTQALEAAISQLGVEEIPELEPIAAPPDG